MAAVVSDLDDRNVFLARPRLRRQVVVVEMGGSFEEDDLAAVSSVSERNFLNCDNITTNSESSLLELADRYRGQLLKRLLAHSDGIDPMHHRHHCIYYGVRLIELMVPSCTSLRHLSPDDNMSNFSRNDLDHTRAFLALWINAILRAWDVEYSFTRLVRFVDGKTIYLHENLLCRVDELCVEAPDRLPLYGPPHIFVYNHHNKVYKLYSEFKSRRLDDTYVWNMLGSLVDRITSPETISTTNFLKNCPTKSTKVDVHANNWRLDWSLMAVDENDMFDPLAVSPAISGHAPK